MKERRRSIRYQNPGNLCRVFSNKSDTPWRLRDISQSGLAFEHHPNLGDMSKLTKIDIFANCPSRFHLTGVPCKTVYDIIELSENRTFTGTEMRRCGLEYESLSKKKEDHLERLLHFLRQHL